MLRDLLRLRRPLGTGIGLDRAQDVVVDALAADPDDERLRTIASLVGVAVS